MTGTATLQDAYDDAVAHLSRAGSPTPDLDATLLVEHTTGMTALDRLTGPERALSPRQHQALRTAVARRMNHEPVHRIIGWRADRIGGPHEYIGKVIEPHDKQTENWDNHRIPDGDIAYIPSLNRYVMIANMRDRKTGRGQSCSGFVCSRGRCG